MAVKKWLLPTNTANLGMMIAQGLICEPKGFSKYYTDILDEQLGYIPVFSEKESQQLIFQALAYAQSEGSDLTPCLIEIDLKNIINGNVYTDEGNPFEISELNSEKDDVNKFFIPSPLPLSCISNVFFSCLYEKNRFISDAKRLYGNVPLDSFKMSAPKAFEKLFSGGKNIELPEINEGKAVKFPELVEIDYKKIYALGGFLSTLFYFSKNGILSDKIFHEACKLDSTDTKIIYDFPLIHNYFYSTEASFENNSSISCMFQEILKIIIYKDKNDCNNSIINFLQSDELSTENDFRKRAGDLAEELMAFHRNTSDKPISEIFEQAKTSKDKSSIKLILLMLFHRKDVESLIDYQLDVFEEEDYLLFAMIFGMRDKFSKTPKFLKEYSELQLYISTLMASYAHKSAKTEVFFKNTKAPPSIISMLKPNKLEFIDWASKPTELNIQSCFKSVMPNKEFLNNKGNSTYSGIVLPKIDIDEALYFREMSKIKIDNTLYDKILLKYKNG